MEWRLYRVWGTWGGCERLLYVGQTGRVPVQRALEHLRSQGWAPLITRWEVDPRVYATQAEVWAVERDAIRDERPLANQVHNRTNPARVVFTQPAGRRPARGRPAGAALRRRATVAAVGVLAVAVPCGWLAAAVMPPAHAALAGVLAGVVVVARAARRARPRRRRR